MKLLSINVSLPKEVPYHGKTVTTSIFKEPVRGRVMVRRLNATATTKPIDACTG